MGKVSPPDDRGNPSGCAGSPYRVVDFAEVPGVPCPCGTARRAFADVAEFPGTIHVTEISENARLHHHRTLTETYYVLECEDDARMQLDDDVIPVRPGVCVMIPPGVRHRAIGRMKVLIVVVPKFDPADEWLD
jgi:mannose-6-phosphate isomerase-like protein (cupin superfamily)